MIRDKMTLDEIARMEEAWAYTSGVDKRGWPPHSKFAFEAGYFCAIQIERDQKKAAS